jgi:uncharacterized protein (DUF1778 family)
MKTKATRSSAKPLKDAVIQLRIPAEQKQALTDVAAREGLELSAWLRQAALRAGGLLPEAKATPPAAVKRRTGSR